MKGDQHKTIEQSIKEPQELRQRITELEAAESQRKKSEEALRQSENKYRFLVDNTREIILIISKRGKIIFANKSTLTNYGYSQDELIGKSITKFLTRDCFKTVLYAIAQEFLGRPQPEIEIRTKTKSGEIRYLKVAEGSVPIYDKGKLMGIMISATDITEHRRAEEKLQESEARFKELWDNAPVAYHTLDTKGIITSVNQTEAKMLGYTKEEMIGKFIFEFILPEQRAEAQKRFQQKISGHCAPKAENRMYVKKDGSKIYVLIDDVLERYKNGKVIGIRTTMVDVTKDKELAGALRISEEHYRDLVEKAGIAIEIDDKEGNLKYANERYAGIFGYSMEEMKKQSIRTLVHPDDVERVMNYHQGRLQGKKVPARYEFKGVRKDGSIIDIEVDAVAQREGKSIIGTRSYLRDITERRQAEEVLQKRSNQLELIHHIQSEIPMNTDIETILIRAAESIGKSFGYYKISVNLYDRETQEIEYLTGWNKTGLPIPRGHRQKLGQGLIGKAGLLRQTIVANDVSQEPDYIPFHLTETKAELIIPLLVQNQLIGVLDLQATEVGAFLKEDVSVLQAVANYIAYIIDEKQQEEVLRESEERYRALFIETPNGICLADAETGMIIDCNKAMTNFVGRDRTELIGQHQNILHPPTDDKTEFSPTFKAHLGIKEGQVLETQIITKTGEIRDVEIKATILNLQGRKILQGIFHDITERKRAEQEVQRRAAQAALLYKVGQRVSSKLELQALLSEIVTSIRDAFDYYGVMLLLLDEEEKVLQLQSIAGGYVEIFPKDLKVELGKGIIGHAVTSGRIQVSGNVSTDPHYYRWANEETKSEMALPIKSGEKVIGVLDVQSDCFNAFDETDIVSIETLSTQIAGAIENARLYDRAQREITERKRSEEELKKSEERFKLVFEYAPDACYLNDLKGNFIDGNRAAERLTGYKREELIGGSFLKLALLSLDQMPKAATLLAKNAMRKPTGPDEFLLKRKNGSKVSVEISTHPVKLEGRTVVLGIARDITERKQAEKVLQESERKLRLLTESMRDVVFVYDMNRRLQYVNPAVEELTGYSIQELHEHNFINYLHPEDQERMMKLWDELFQGKSFSGEELRIVTKDGKTKWCSSSWGPLFDENGNQIGIQGRESDITERKLAKKQLEESFNNLRKAMNGIIQAIALTVERRDPYTAGHQRRVADLARAIAAEMALPKDKIEGIRIAGIIHDIGKISIPAEILSKPGSLNEFEFHIIKDHAKVGYDILKELEFPWPIAQIVFQHHERMDGSGYPQGLTGEDILLEARILGVADVVEAMASHRPYRPAKGIEKALEEILQNKGRLYDPEVVEACLKVFTKNKFEFKL